MGSPNLILQAAKSSACLTESIPRSPEISASISSFGREISVLSETIFNTSSLILSKSSPPGIGAISLSKPIAEDSLFITIWSRRLSFPWSLSLNTFLTVSISTGPVVAMELSHDR